MADIPKILEPLSTFFPHEGYTEEIVESCLNNDEIVTDGRTMTNALKGALHDETIIEVQLQDLSRTFFCRVLDDPPPEPDPAEDGEETARSPSYEKGSYLESREHVIITPLEPAIGNFLICYGQDVRTLLKIVSSSRSLELGCFFRAKIKLNSMPVLKISFPEIGRRVEKSRLFRAKIPQDMTFTVQVYRKSTKAQFSTTPLNISTNGMALLDPMGKQSDLQVEEDLLLELKVPDMESVAVEANIRHVSKLRHSRGIQYFFGVRFDLANRTLAAAIENVVGAVQRRHLRELAAIADEFGVNYEDW